MTEHQNSFPERDPLNIMQVFPGNILQFIDQLTVFFSLCFFLSENFAVPVWVAQDHHEWLWQRIVLLS